MEYRSEIYGFNPETLLTSPAEVRRRLEAILGDKVLRFNPYSVDDATLLACAERAGWLPWPSLTQMAVFHFQDIRKVDWTNPYKAIFFHIGSNPREMSLSMNMLTRRVIYTATLRQIHVMVNGRPLTNETTVERMQGNDYFVSHALPARTETGHGRNAYRMYRLKGNEEQKAAMIREKMIESKIAMLQEIIAYPYTPQYLRCSRNFIDYVSPIEAAISAIRRFPEIRDKGCCP